MLSNECPFVGGAKLFRRLPDMTPMGLATHAELDAHCHTHICVVQAAARVAELIPARRPLTLSAATAGRVRYRFGHRDLVVDDDTLLVVHSGRVQRVGIEESAPVELTQVFFPDALMRDVQRNWVRGVDALLADPIDDFAGEPVEPLEGLVRQPRRLSPALHYVRHCIRTGTVTHQWLEEQAHYLLDALVAMQQRRHQRLQLLDCVRRATRVELYRRAALAADYIDSYYDRNCGLDELATVACLSKFHLLRSFKQIYGVTPQSYKEQRRVLAAHRLMRDTSLSMAEIAARVGYSSPASLRVQLERWGRGEQISNKPVSNSQVSMHG